MDNIYILGADGELYHHGTKGMKWGIRRYQNKDGSLTTAGKKRYAQEEAKLKERERVVKNRERVHAKLSKIESKNAELKAREEALAGEKITKKTTKPAPEKPKTMKDMSDAELRAHVARMQLEKSYIDAQNNLAAVTPKHQKPAEKFVKSLMNDVIAPAAKNAGKAWLEKTLKDKLGLDEKDPLKKLESKYKKLEWETKIKDLEKAGTLKEKKETSWDEKRKEQQYYQDMIKTQQAKDDYKTFMKNRKKSRKKGNP